MRLCVKIAVVLLGLACGAMPARAQVAVIAHPSVPIDSIDKTDLLYLYTLDVQAWDNKLRVVVFDLKAQGPLRDTFYKYLGKTSARMRSIWLKRKLSGEGDPPVSFDTEQEMLAHVAATRGAIGFVHRSRVNGEVKTLATIPLEDQ